MHAFVVANERTELILASEIIMADELEPVAAKLAEVFRGGGFTGRRGLPREILFTSVRLYDTFCPALAALGVRTGIGEDPTFLADLIDSLREGLSGPRPSHDLPRTIGEWKKIDKRVTDRLREAAVKEELLTTRTMAQYFGSEDQGKRVLSELSSLSPLDAFVEWVVSDYRPTKRSRTYVEKLLELRGLDPAERVVLEAHVEHDQGRRLGPHALEGPLAVLHDLDRVARRCIRRAACRSLGAPPRELPSVAAP